MISVALHSFTRRLSKTNHRTAQNVAQKKAKDCIHSIHKLSISSIVNYYCVTGGVDGDLRVWVSLSLAPPFLGWLVYHILTRPTDVRGKRLSAGAIRTHKLSS
jgi:hypothetical protein